MRKTLVVHNRYAWRSFRTRAALIAEQGLQLFTMEQLAARLAGGFFQPVSHDDLSAAVAAALVAPMGDLDAIKTYPDFSARRPRPSRRRGLRASIYKKRPR